MLNRLLALAGKEFIQLRRDKRTLAMMVVLPLLWLVLFGYAFSFDVESIRLVVADQSGTATGALVAQAFREHEKADLVDLGDGSASDLGDVSAVEDAIRAAMYRDEVQMAVVIPAGFTGSPPGPPIKVLLDGADLFAAQTGTRMLQKVLESLQAKVQVAVPPAAGQPGAAPVVPPGAGFLVPEVETLFNPELSSAMVMIPGLLGLVVMFMATLMTTLGIVREREHGTLEQLVVTPITPLELMLGKIIPPFVIAAADFALVYILGTRLFDLTFAGNFPLFIGLSLLLVFTTLGLGLLLSTVAQNQQQAMQLAMFSVFPQILVSGLIFPLASLPRWVQSIAYALPFTHYVPIARGMFVKGQGLDQLSTPALVLAGYAVAVLALASIRFRKRLG